MAETDPDRLLVVSLSTFEVVTLVWLGVTVGHATGSLADPLGGLGTTTGLVAFGYLWLLAFVATRWVTDSDGLDALVRGPLRRPLSRATVGGAFVGVGQFFGIVVAGAVAVVGPGLPSPITVAIVVGVGTLVSLAIGALIGLVFGVAGITLARVGVRLGGTTAGEP
ncbi:MAG: hypothetical protein ABEI99_02585 [Halobaculum sp.]